MREFIVQVASTAPVEPTDTTADNYQLNRWAYEQSLNLWEMNQQGFTVTQTEESDLTDAQTVIDNMSEGLLNWLDAASVNYQQGIALPALDFEYIPELITFVAAALTGDWSGVFLLFAEVGLKFLITWLNKSMEPNAGVPSEPRATEAQALLSELHINILNNEDEQEEYWSSNT